MMMMITSKGCVNVSTATIIDKTKLQRGVTHNNYSKMVKLSAKYLKQRNKANKYFLVRKKGDTDKDFFKRITHLPVQNQFIEEILEIPDCENVKVLYLQNNLLKTLNNLDSFPNLTHLYLQRNFLIKIENLNELKNLKKIYLGHNEIQVLEGMENLEKIKEIHLESQDLQAGDTLYFEPLTMRNLGTTLQVLNISDNYLTSLLGLKELVSLKTLIANDNYLKDINDITSTILEWHSLKQLSLIGNEVTLNRWYKDSVIFASKTLETLDGMPVHPNTRIYIEKLFELKKKSYLKQISKTKEEKSEKRKTLTFADDVESKENSFHFIKNFPPLIPIYVHPAWKLRSNVNSVNPKTFLPRPYWKKGGMRSINHSSTTDISE